MGGDIYNRTYKKMIAIAHLFKFLGAIFASTLRGDTIAIRSC